MFITQEALNFPNPQIKTQIEQWQAVIDALPDPVFILTENGRYADLVGGRDPSFYHNGSHLIGKSLIDVLAPEKANWFIEQIRYAIEIDGLHTVEYGLSGADVKGLDTSSGPEGVIWFEGRIQPLKEHYNGEKAVVWVARNITQRHALEYQLRQLSETDFLTGVSNKRKLLSQLTTLFSTFKRHQHNVSLLMIDVDYFKNINDIYGHLQGDKILKNIANICKQQLRNEDLMFRYGGEEFVIILPHISPEQAYAYANRIRLAVSQEIKLDKVKQVSISIGIAEFESVDEQEDRILGRADQALYKAKNNGRNCIEIFQAS